MTHTHDTPHSDSFDTLDWDESDIRDLIRTTPLRFDDDGQPAGYEAEQLIGLEELDLVGRFR